MPSVASDPTSIFPVSRPLPGHRTAGPEQSGPGAEPFAALLEHEPAQPPRAKHVDARRRGDAAPSEDSRRSDAAKHTKDKDDAKVGGTNPEATQAHAETGEASKDAAAEASSELGTAQSADELNSQMADADGAATVGVAQADAAAEALLAPAAAQIAAAATATPVIATLDIAGAIAADAAPVTVPTVAAPDAQGATPASAEIAAAAANAAKPAPAARADKPAVAPSPTPSNDSTPEAAKPAPTPTLPDVASQKAEVPAAARAAAAAKPTLAIDAANPDGNGALKTAGEVLQNLGLTAPTAHSGAAPAQSTAAATAAAAAAPAQPSSTPVPVASLAVELAAQALAGKHRFEIRLDPPELGRIDVRLEIDRDGNVTSRLVVERAETLDMLRRDAPQLERALQQAGLKTADNALEFSLRQQTPERHDDAPGRGPRLATEDKTAASIDAAQINYGRRLGLGGGLDIKV